MSGPPDARHTLAAQGQPPIDVHYITQWAQPLIRHPAEAQWEERTPKPYPIFYKGLPSLWPLGMGVDGAADRQACSKPGSAYLVGFSSLIAYVWGRVRLGCPWKQMGQMQEGSCHENRDLPPSLNGALDSCPVRFCSCR